MKNSRKSQQIVSICMHIRGVARLDPRVTRSANALREAGFQLTIIDIENDHTRRRAENIRGVHTKHMLKPEWLLPTRFPMRLFQSLAKFCYSIFYLLRTPADIYHAHNDNTLLPCFIVALLRRKPLIFEAHEMPLYVLEHIHPLLATAITGIFKAMIQRCAGVIVVSPPIVQEVQKHYNVSNIALVRNIPPYRRVTNNHRLRTYLGLSTTTRIVLYQGNIQPDRCLDTLVRATKFLSRDIVVVLMGKDVGTTSAKLINLAIQEGHIAQLKILPPVSQDELLEWTASADIGVIMSSPGYSKNTRVFLPNKLFEYMMAGLPVLSSPLSAVEEILRTYDVGRVLDSLEPADVARTIETMLADRNHLASMSENALRASAQEFCWKREKLHLLRLYHQVLLHHLANRETVPVFQQLEAMLAREEVHDAYSLYL